MHTQPDIKNFDQSAFRKALSCFPTGVGVATIVSADGQPHGMTISSFNSVSMNPPLILWSIGLEAACLDDFRQAEAFAINILAADQKPISQQTLQRTVLVERKTDSKTQQANEPIRILPRRQASNHEACDCQRGRRQGRSLKITH